MQAGGSGSEPQRSRDRKCLNPLEISQDHWLRPDGQSSKRVHDGEPPFPTSFQLTASRISLTFFDFYGFRVVHPVRSCQAGGMPETLLVRLGRPTGPECSPCVGSLLIGVVDGALEQPGMGRMGAASDLAIPCPVR